jgi:microcin C transport system substrate-binding protein
MHVSIEQPIDSADQTDVPMVTPSFLRPAVVLFGLLGLVPSLRAEQSFPPAGWQPAPSPLASPQAEPGGKFSVHLSQFPKSFNYLLDNNQGSRQIFQVMFENLMSVNELSLAFEPNLAKTWTISDDKLTFTVHLDETAKWSDGQPVTAADVVWTVEAILKPENLTGPHKVGLDEFKSFKALDERTIEFTAKQVHWRNLVSIATFPILPKHWWEKQDFNKVNFQFPVVSGPYAIGELKEPDYVRMTQRKDYWAKAWPQNQGLRNFDEVEFRFYPDDDMAYDAFKTGAYDFISVYVSHRWVEGTKIEQVDKNWIVKQRVANHNPVGFQGFAMNLRRDKFKDVRVRKALAMCLNREEFNKTLMFNQYFLHRSYWEDLWNAQNPCPNPLIPFDPDQARKLLDEAGWVPNPSTGIREKGGVALKIVFLERDPSSSKFLLPYKEILKNVGIELTIQQTDWAGWTREMNEYNYDMTWAAWGASIFNDPEASWHSKWVSTPNGNNITGFANPEVDALIEGMRTEFNTEKRNESIRKIDQILAAEMPYVLLWNRSHHRLLYWNKFGMPDHVLGAIEDESNAKLYLWLDPDQEADLEAAMEAKLPLPPRPATVTFDEVFKLNPGQVPAAQ